MNIGDGLRIQSQTIGGKTTSGIFFVPVQDEKRFKAQAKQKGRPLKFSSKVNKEPIKTTSEQNVGNKDVPLMKKGTKQISKPNKSTVTKKSEKVSGNDIVLINDNSDKKSKPSSPNEQPLSKSKLKPNVSNSKNKSVTNQPNVTGNKSNVKTKQSFKDAKSDSKEIKVDTNFVTLTQDQLNIILNLVKTKQDIDIADALKKEDNKQKEDLKENDSDQKPKSSEGIKVEPTFVPGLDLGEEETKDDTNQESDKENTQTENVKNLLEKSSHSGTDSNQASESRGSTATKKPDASNKEEDKKSSKDSEKAMGELFGTLGGYGSRERERSQIEERRKKWIEGLNEQVEQKKKMQSKHSHATGASLKLSSIDESKIKSKKENIEVTSGRHSAPSSASQREHQEEKTRSISSNNVDAIHVELPAAIRSSFFLGEAAPREHAFSAKKKKEQLLWKEELEKQIKEKEELRMKKKENLEVEGDNDAWARHFETMNPTSDSSKQLNSQSDDIPNQPSSQVALDQPLPQHAHNTQVLSPRTTTTNSALVDHISGIYSGDHSINSADQRSHPSHVRTMTALLDPSQIDAIELKRQKQMEHRRVIAEQVEERRRMKEEALRLKREEEEEEERRLEEERRKIKNQFEREKNKQLAMEEKRDRQTQELYQQMQEAQASAMKEKFEKRQRDLRNHGHDTSRLERTHKNVLENTVRPLRSPTRTSPVPPLNIASLNNTSQLNLHPSISPRISTEYQQSSQQPVSVLTSTGPVPIQLEISINQRNQQQPMVTASVQTDEATTNNTKKKKKKKNDSFLDILSDSDGTEYMDLPYPSARNVEKLPKNKSRAATNNDSHYNKYSRTNQPVKTRSNEKPKWGVGKGKKDYVPASNRYLNSKRWKEERDARIRRREEDLLHQQALNNPERLLAVRKAKADTLETESPTTYSRMMRHQGNMRRDRSKSPEKRQEVTSIQPTTRNRSHSPPVPAVKNQLRDRDKHRHIEFNRPTTAMSVTTDQAKYKSSKHTPNSPVPDTDDFVEYLRSDVILDPNQSPSRPASKDNENELHYRRDMDGNGVHKNADSEPSKDPLINADLVKQRERQDKILKEISILRQGLLLKQREVASYPIAITKSDAPLRNLPERSNDGTIK